MEPLRQKDEKQRKYYLLLFLAPGLTGCKKVSAIFYCRRELTLSHEIAQEWKRTYKNASRPWVFCLCGSYGHELAPHSDQCGIAIGLRTSQCVWNRNLEPRRYRTNCVTSATHCGTGTWNLRHSSRGTRTWNPDRGPTEGLSVCL